MGGHKPPPCSPFTVDAELDGSHVCFGGLMDVKGGRVRRRLALRLTLPCHGGNHLEGWRMGPVNAAVLGRERALNAPQTAAQIGL